MAGLSRIASYLQAGMQAGCMQQPLRRKPGGLRKSNVNAWLMEECGAQEEGNVAAGSLPRAMVLVMAITPGMAGGCNRKMQLVPELNLPPGNTWYT